jgi:hypothetical protein
MRSRLIIIGAGPIGLAAAIGGLDRGFDVTVLEKTALGASLRRWGLTRFFTPLGMNISPRMRTVAGRDLPPDDALLTGPEMADQVLVPIAESPMLAGRVRIGSTVRAIGRRGLTKTDFPGHPLRAERPFRLLVETADGEDQREDRPRARDNRPQECVACRLANPSRRPWSLCSERSRPPRADRGVGPTHAGDLGRALAEPSPVRRGGRRSTARTTAGDGSRQRSGRIPSTLPRRAAARHDREDVDARDFDRSRVYEWGHGHVRSRRRIHRSSARRFFPRRALRRALACH